MEYEARLATFIDPVTNHPGFEAELVSAIGQEWQEAPVTIPGGQKRQLAWLRAVGWVLNHTHPGDHITWMNTANAIALQELIRGSDRETHQSPYYRQLYDDLDQRASRICQSDGTVYDNPYGLSWSRSSEGFLTAQEAVNPQKVWEESFDQWNEERQDLLAEIQHLSAEVQRWQETAILGHLRSRKELNEDLQQWFGPALWKRLEPYHEGLLMAHREVEVAQITHDEGTYRDAAFNVWKVFEQVLRQSWMASIARWVAHHASTQRHLWRADRQEVVVALESTSHQEKSKQIRWPLREGNVCTLGDMEALLFDRVIGHYVRPEYWTTLLAQWIAASQTPWISEPSFYQILEQARTHRNPHAHTFPITTLEDWHILWETLMNPTTGWVVKLVSTKWP